jgi:phage terminase large subunit-like protein
MDNNQPPGDSLSDDPVTGYARGVVAGEIIAGPHVRATCARHLKDLIEGGSRGLVWDLDAALHTIQYYREVLCLNGGEFEGKPFYPEPWQLFCIGSLFGWKNRDGTRRFQTSYVEQLASACTA